MESAFISAIAVHYAGNKTLEEGIRQSQSLLQTEDEVSDLLQHYFLSPFKGGEYFTFHHESSLNLNEVYTYVTNIFNDSDTLYEESVNLLKHLYESSDHPKIKGGEFYVVFFEDCPFKGEMLNAVGLFKSESRESFLKVYPKGGDYSVEKDEGININKLDKGCLIYNTEADKGYVVSVIDHTGKNSEARYWIDQFLHLRQREDEFFQTREALNLCKDFVTRKLPEDYEVSKADQVDLLKKSVEFFKEKERFNLEEFADEVMKQPEIIEKFKAYKTDYQKERDIDMEGDFSISEDAVKKQARAFKSIIKLDKNFHIYVHGKREYIVKGFDQASGMHYYQLFFYEEN
jgi:hypothetical protein